MSSALHNCGRNVLLASIFGRKVATQEHAENPKAYQADLTISWTFRLWLAEQLPKSGYLGATSVEDWRRTLIMLYEDPLFKPEEFQVGFRGQGPDLSIAEFKNWQEQKLNDWLKSEEKWDKNTTLLKNRVMESLKAHRQWEDLKHHHLAFISRVLNVEINVRTSENQNDWICIRPSEFEPEVKIPSVSFKHTKKIYLQNDQQYVCWHYNLIMFPETGYGMLEDWQVEENLNVRLPDGRTFRELFWSTTENAAPKMNTPNIMNKQMKQLNQKISLKAATNIQNSSIPTKKDEKLCKKIPNDQNYRNAILHERESRSGFYHQNKGQSSQLHEVIGHEQKIQGRTTSSANKELKNIKEQNSLAERKSRKRKFLTMKAVKPQESYHSKSMDLDDEESKNSGRNKETNKTTDVLPAQPRRFTKDPFSEIRQ